MPNKKKHLFNFLGSLIIFVSGFGIAWIIKGNGETQIKPATAFFTEQREGQYKLINPLLECTIAEDILASPLGVSRFKINDLVDRKLKAKEADLISVYFRDLNNGPWIGIREKEEFLGASLLKVPLMIAYLKEAESNPEILNQKIKYGKINPAVSLSQFFNPSKEIKLGNEYTVRELLEYMIKYSDNNAADLLGSSIEPEEIIEVFKALGMGLPEFNKPYPVSVRTYGGFFRILFNASYLSKEMSELALEILAESEFDKGLTANIPQEIVVSHKHGIREIDEKTGKQLHDCGIIYYPNHPYLLCVMTRGDDFNKLSEVIKDLSKLIYDEMSRSKD